MLGPILDEVKQELGDQADIMKIDVDKNSVLSSQLGIRSVPTLILFKKGKIIWRHSAVVQKQELIALLQQSF